MTKRFSGSPGGAIHDASTACTDEPLTNKVQTLLTHVIPSDTLFGQSQLRTGEFQ